MKKVICLVLAAALMIGLNLSVAGAAEEREPVFGSGGQTTHVMLHATPNREHSLHSQLAPGYFINCA